MKLVLAQSGKPRGSFQWNHILQKEKIIPVYHVINTYAVEEDQTAAKLDGAIEKIEIWCSDNIFKLNPGKISHHFW